MKVFVVFGLICLSVVHAHMYSEGSNEKVEKLERPFRMAKINAVWEKAKKRLSETKLRSLHRELLLQDKEELVVKRMRTEGQDKDGLKEAQARRSLATILDRYNLADRFDDPPPSKKTVENKMFNEANTEKLAKKLFKDKKMHKLWQKAQKSGFTQEELSALQEEFLHHQEKIEQYHQLLNSEDPYVDEELNMLENDIKKSRARLPEVDEAREIHKEKSDLLRERKNELKHSYERLERLSAQGPGFDDFTEHKVAELWKMAKEADFSKEELASLKTELTHYEHRLLKLRFLKSDTPQQRIHDDSHKQKVPVHDKPSHTDKIERQERHAQKLHRDLEAKIMQRHLEL